MLIHPIEPDIASKGPIPGKIICTGEISLCLLPGFLIKCRDRR